MQDNPATTGKPDDLPEAFAANGEGLPWKVFSLRQKLYHKAKREPGFRFYALYDRVVQTAVLLILEPIYEAYFLDCSYGFRPNRSAHQALGEIRRNLEQGRREIYDADLSSYFDTIPHDKLMACVRKRVTDRSVLHLIRMWLSAVVVEAGEGPEEPPKYSRSRQGTPQGGVISPLLANLYLHWFDYKFHREDGPYRWANARLVRYADDFVIMARYVGGRIEQFVEQTVQGWMGLKVNLEKTRTVKLHAPGVGLDFLGYTFRYDRDLYGREGHYLNLIPSKTSLQRVRDRLKKMTDARQCFTPIRQMIERINRMQRGWQGYFSQGYPRQAYRDVDNYTLRRLRIHLGRRSQRAYKKPKGETWWDHLQRLGWRPLQTRLAKT